MNDNHSELIEYLDEKFNKVDERFDKLESRVINVEEDVKEIKSDFKELKESIGNTFSKIDEFLSMYKKQEQEFTIIKRELQKLQERVSQLEEKAS